MTAQRRDWILFDLDGTLLDYAAAEVAAVTATLEEVGLAVGESVLSAYRAINARHWAALERRETTASRLRLERWRDLLEAEGLSHVAAEQLAASYLGHLARGTDLIDGATEMLGVVASTHRLGLLTNGLADVQRPRIDASGLAPYFEAVIISDEVGAAKPDPAIFDAALLAMGEPDRDAVTLVGDSLTADIAGGRAYGLRTVWFAHPEVASPDSPALQADHRIADLRELPGLLSETTRAS